MPELPGIKEIAGDFSNKFFTPLLICDSNTEHIASKICGNAETPVCVLNAGESFKNWQAIESILRSAHDAGIGRDGIFIGIGGGVVSDLSAFAASIYMRGCSHALVPTTLLGMVDAGLGGKTGFDLFGKKNLAGTFYPARHVYIAAESLATLPLPEWKSGMAELIKTAILGGDDFLNELLEIAANFQTDKNGGSEAALARCVSRAVKIKGGIVEEDPLETGSRRVLLNLGHTFGHALESVAGLGTVSHGEAVAWGIARSCDLGQLLGITPQLKAEKIKALLNSRGYELRSPHPLMKNPREFTEALYSDKKKCGGLLMFIVPDEKSARSVTIDSAELMDAVNSIVNGEQSI
ncbi:MAG: 3-dehydroquinate synthase [Treponema sp.]|nr:3-dehydroquinate synthase [Treponema sp.]